MLKYFFVSISFEQLQEFENFVLEQQRDAEYEDLLKDLSSQMPLAVKGSKLASVSDSIGKILDYK